jgi:hypothetical protein
MSDGLLVGLMVGLFAGGLIGALGMAIVSAGSGQRFSREPGKRPATADTVSGSARATARSSTGVDLPRDLRETERHWRP